jgi:aldehyde:ferredoxin oxidoreductase
VYLWISNEEVELRSAEDLWGKTIPEATDMIKEATGDETKVACIGPAGEKLVKFACILNEYNRAAGRSGVGAVMGSKNLKAVAVRGTRGIKVADNDAFLKAVTEARAMLKAHPVTGAGLAAYGTNVLVNILNEHGGLPVKILVRPRYFLTPKKFPANTRPSTIWSGTKAVSAVPLAVGG